MQLLLLLLLVVVNIAARVHYRYCGAGALCDIIQTPVKSTSPNYITSNGGLVAAVVGMPVANW